MKFFIHLSLAFCFAVCAGDLAQTYAGPLDRLPQEPRRNPVADSMLRVPGVVGMAYPSAADMLQQAGLNPLLKRIRDFQKKYAGMEGQVVKQIPGPGGMAMLGSSVALSVYEPERQEDPMGDPYSDPYPRQNQDPSSQPYSDPYAPQDAAPYPQPYEDSYAQPDSDPYAPQDQGTYDQGWNATQQENDSPDFEPSQGTAIPAYDDIDEEYKDSGVQEELPVSLNSASPPSLDKAPLPKVPKWGSASPTWKGPKPKSADDPPTSSRLQPKSRRKAKNPSHLEFAR